MHPISSIPLNSQIARLEPLSAAHIPDLALAGSSAAIWEFMRYGKITDKERLSALLERK